MANYEHTTILAFRTKVYEKLGQQGVVTFWPEEEINQTIEEALLTFGAIAQFWKEDIILPTEENKRIYDLHKLADISNGAINILPSYTMQTIINWLNRDLIENLSNFDPVTEFMDLTSWLRAIDTKYNEFQLATQLVISRLEIVVPPNTNVINLPETLIDLVRVTFKYTEEDLFTEEVISKSDEHNILQNDPSALENTAFPSYYTITYNPTKQITLYPIPANHGTLEILYVDGVKRIPTTASEIDLPNNLIPYLKFGVLADIFAKDGLLKDPIRSAYAQQRWQEGIFIGKNYTSVMKAKANGRFILLDSLASFDNYFPLEKVRTPPAILGFAGYNIFATDIVPSAEVASLELTINANAKIPINDNDFIRIDLEYIDTLADYVVHLSMIKVGAAELSLTDNLKNKFLQKCIEHSSRLDLRSESFQSIMGITKQQEKSEPRIVRDNGGN